MLRCAQCGGEVSENDRFCFNCGAAQTASPVTQESKPATEKERRTQELFQHLKSIDVDAEIVNGCVRTTWRSKSPLVTCVSIEFDEDGKGGHLTSAVSRKDLPLVPEDMASQVRALTIVNEQNMAWRWLTFYLKKDNRLFARTDFRVDDGSANQVVEYLIRRHVSIWKQCIGEFKKIY